MNDDIQKNCFLWEIGDAYIVGCRGASELGGSLEGIPLGYKANKLTCFRLDTCCTYDCIGTSGKKLTKPPWWGFGKNCRVTSPCPVLFHKRTNILCNFVYFFLINQIPLLVLYAPLIISFCLLQTMPIYN